MPVILGRPTRRPIPYDTWSRCYALMVGHDRLSHTRCSWRPSRHGHRFRAYVGIWDAACAQLQGNLARFSCSSTVWSLTGFLDVCVGHVVATGCRQVACCPPPRQHRPCRARPADRSLVRRTEAPEASATRRDRKSCRAIFVGLPSLRLDLRQRSQSLNKVASRATRS